MRINLVATFLLLTTAGLLLAVPVKGQLVSTEKVTFSLKHESLEKAISELQAQTPFIYYYRKADVKAFDNLSLAYGTRTVQETLQALLQNTFLVFRQEGQNIFIEKTRALVTYRLNGRVVDKNHQGFPFATVKLTRANSSAMVQGTQTDTGGYYKLNVSEKGDYLVHISAIGMDSLSVALTLDASSTVQLPDITLSASTKQLSEVSVVGKKAFIEQKIDRTVVNVGSLISNDGANGLEVLEKSPGVIVDGNGNISFKGKTGVLVLINGKPTYLSGADLAAYLKSLPASTLDQIELMDNPPAKYDAAGDAGVINIKTKKSKTAGFNGSLAASYGQAHYGQTSESLNLNYHQGKVNLFANAAYNISQVYRSIELDRAYFNPDGSAASSIRQTEYIMAKNYNTNLKLGMDYYLSPKTTCGIVLTGKLSPGRFDNPSTDRLFNGAGLPDSTVSATNHSKGHFNNGGINLNYSHEFDKGKVLTFDLDYLKYSSVSDRHFLNQTFLPDGTLTDQQIITDHLPTGINIYSAKTDYTHALPGNAKLETGLKSSYVNTDNAANYYDVNGGASTPNDQLSNQFLYKENINAAYLNFNKPFGRFELQTGLRLENTNSDGHQLGNTLHPDSSFSKHYTDLFPTAYVSYKLDSTGRQTLVASYGRRIGRPFYQELNPFVLVSDKFTYSAGNPYLRPQFADNYKLTFNYSSIFSGALFYNHVSDLQSEVIRQQGQIFIDGTGNIGSANYIGASVNIAVEPASWWQLNAYLQLIHNHFKGQLYASYLDQSSTYGQINMTSQFTFPHGWSAELSGYYVSRFANGQSMIDPFGQLNGGIQKKILHNQAAIKFNVRDILNTYRADGENNFIPNTVSTFRNRFNAQAFTLGFSYNFGTAVNQKKRDTGGAATEQNRVKN
ncbi:outer membrane beta-barrel protein [Mucilaginibacter sp.]|uniref:outer membrane beta-barrel protein n=1 Tax=Mucilaginibacter sp. TaxID=1882438 RepID=UPI0028511AD5|nr:outer membrane beta-barrel protein [Mucilaginibacter sp.]MDR3695120.1 TonB-dependent receptor [Mucilaginibacter sp.]